MPIQIDTGCGLLSICVEGWDTNYDNAWGTNIKALFIYDRLISDDARLKNLDFVNNKII